MDNSALNGRRVVVTRAAEQAQELRRALESLGAEVLLLPTVAFAPPEDWREVDEALRKLSGFDAILFLSRNAVRYIFERCRELDIKSEALNSPRCLIAAVGTGTGEAVVSQGVQVDYIAKNQSGEALAGELGGRVAGRNVLLPRSDRGDERLSAALIKAGARVTEVVAYRTIAPESTDSVLLSRIQRGEADAIVFASPSAFHNFAALPGADPLRLSARVQFVAIGPTTARAIREAGANVAVEAAEPSATGIADALTKYYEREGLSHAPHARRA